MNRGENLPAFVAAQLEFAGFIRNPEVNDAPAGIEARRMKIYADLFYNNIQNFLAGAFPVCKRILLAADWHGVAWHTLVRSFVHRHGSTSPYFLDIPQEFLEFVGSGPHEPLPDWFLELAHYEWVEMALAVSDEELPDGEAIAGLAEGVTLVSPLAWPLSYRYGVHEIGPGHLPERVPAEPTHLVVYRRRDDNVRFLVSNVVTHTLIALLQENSDEAAAVAELAARLGLDHHVVAEQATRALARLRDCEIVFGGG